MHLRQEQNIQWERADPSNTRPKTAVHLHHQLLLIQLGSLDALNTALNAYQSCVLLFSCYADFQNLQQSGIGSSRRPSLLPLAQSFRPPPRCCQFTFAPVHATIRFCHGLTVASSVDIRAFLLHVFLQVSAFAYFSNFIRHPRSLVLPAPISNHATQSIEAHSS